MNNMTRENLNRWDVKFPLQPGDLPDDTFMTADGLKRQTAHLGADVVGGRIVNGRVVVSEMDLKSNLRRGRGTTPAMGPG
jgi:hypothetical protein